MYELNRIKTLHPNLTNATTDERVPVPIETAYFLEEAEQDRNKPNRYYFNFPAEWSTANRGESIIGIRNIVMNPRQRKLEFTIGVRKYHREDYDKLSSEHPDYGPDLIYENISIERKVECSFNVISWIPTDKDLREVFKDLEDAAIAKFEVENEKNKELNDILIKVATDDIEFQIAELIDQNNQLKNEHSKLLRRLNYWQEQYDNLFKKDPTSTQLDILLKEIENYQKDTDAKKEEIDKLELELAQKEYQKNKIELQFRPYFRQEKEKQRRRDIQMDGRYYSERNCFVEIIESPTNAEGEENMYYVDLRINFNPRPSNDSTNETYDFADVMNIGDQFFQNSPNKYLGKWLRKIEFENVWDRQPCKVYSSIAEDSSKGYLGSSHIDFQPIKYFKLNSTDQRFWVEFYSSSHYKIPIALPKNESFVIEMQLLPFNKMLYV